jgi:predicted metal-dependent phosphoesterase TrpH
MHCHSRFSYDSNLSISAYLRFAKAFDLDFVVLTDHDTIAGSLVLREAAAKRLPRLEVPIAAEYLTDCGDVIALFLKSELKARRFDDLVEEARSQGALLFLPHPYVAHTNIQKLAEKCDRIEVFNSRLVDKHNAKALELARSLDKKTCGGADAHLAASLGRVIVELEDRGDLRTSLLHGEMSWTSGRTPKWERAASQGIKAIKKRDPALAIDLAGGALRGLGRTIFR